jgi:sugar O-acyltransferase (sialic acid O-acetyltransferase NeuD family)
MSGTRSKIFVFGASGHAKVIIDIIEQEGSFDIAFLIDDDPALKGSDFFGYPVIGGKQELLCVEKRVPAGIVAIGSNFARMNVANWLKANGYSLVSAIHPAARIGRGSSLGCGSVVMASAVINPATLIGELAIINTGANIDHDCRIGNGVHIAPGSTLCGSVSVGDGSFICAGATIIPNLTLGKNVIVGAGSTVVSDLSDNVTAVGSPARILER